MKCTSKSGNFGVHIFFILRIFTIKKYKNTKKYSNFFFYVLNFYKGSIMLKKYLIAVILSFALFGCCFIRPCENKVFAQNQNVTYVAFGDSIAEGYAINLKTKTDDETLITGADDSYAVTENCYVDLVSKLLK